MRERQEVWFSVITEKRSGIDTIKEYSNPVSKRVTVSCTSGSPLEVSAGIVPDYDRYITSYDRDFCKEVVEGMALWVDTIPALNEDGSLEMSDDGFTPVVPPDYTLSKIMDTRKGIVARYGITKLGASV